VPAAPIGQSRDQMRTTPTKFALWADAHETQVRIIIFAIILFASMAWFQPTISAVCAAFALCAALFIGLLFATSWLFGRLVRVFKKAARA
jgi:hypothetical protein